MSEAVPGWTYVGTTFEGGAITVHGVNPWESEWRSERSDIQVPHPTYPNQRHRLSVVQLPSGKRFAAGELSNGVWCFYVPDTAGAGAVK